MRPTEKLAAVLKCRRNQRVIGAVMLALALLLLLASPAQATEYDWQGYRTHADIMAGPWVSTKDAIYTMSHLYSATGDVTTYTSRIGCYQNSGAGYYCQLNTSGSKQELAYVAWDQGFSYTNVYDIYWFDSTGAVIANKALSPPGQPLLQGSNGDEKKVELKRIGNDWKAYGDGRYLGTLITTSTSAYAIAIYPGAGSFVIDNLILGDSNPYMISGLPTDWYLKRDFITPSLKGVVNESGNTMSTNAFDIDWTVYSIDTYTIEVKHTTDGFVANTTTWTAASDNTTGWCGNRTISLDASFIDNSAPYGLYNINLKDSSGSILDSGYAWYTAAGASIAWDDNYYAAGDTANISTSVSVGYWDTSLYDYSGAVLNIYGEEMATWTITSQTQYEEIDLVDYDTGVYYATVTATSKSSGTKYLMAYDAAEISDSVEIEGLTVAAQTATLLSGATVGAYQSSVWHNTTSSGGLYNISDMTYGEGIQMYGRKPKYDYESFTFTPPAGGTYNITMVFVPGVIWNSTASSSASIVGVVREDWSHSPISTATVWISNTTWTGSSNTTNGAGYYEFHDLASGASYTLNATATGYTRSIDYEETPTHGQHSVQYIDMSPAYTLGVECIDGSSDTRIVGDLVSLSLSDGQTTTTTTGIGQFTTDFGVFTVSGSVDGYYPNSRSLLMTGNRNTTLTFTREVDEGGAGISYPPHQVRFMVRNLWGVPLQNIQVTAQGYETTVGPWDWLISLLGMELDETPIHNESMSGSTTIDGSIVFMMIESVAYEMTFTNATQGVSERFTVYPKDDYYEFYVSTGGEWYAHGVSPAEALNITVSGDRVSTTAAFINVSYNDSVSDTTGVTIFINQTSKTDTDAADTKFKSTSVNGDSDFNYSFSNLDADDQSYLVVFEIQHATFGNVTRVFSVAFEKAQVTIGVPSTWLVYMAVFFILFTGMFFGATTSPTVGAVITCFMGWIMWGIGWLDGFGIMAPTALVFATFIAVLSVIMARSRKERYL